MSHFLSYYLSKLIHIYGKSTKYDIMLLLNLLPNIKGKRKLWNDSIETIFRDTSHLKCVVISRDIDGITTIISQASQTLVWKIYRR